MKVLKKEILERIKDCTPYYPFMASKWEVSLIKKEHTKKENNEITFGRYNTNSSKPMNFYKHISKYIDFNKIENEK